MPLSAATAPDLFHALFEAQVDRTPDATALLAGGEAITYRALDERANRLARRIRASYRADKGEELPPETPIGLCAGRGAETVASVLGILKAGAGWVPLDPGYPPDRLTYMLADSAAPMVLAQHTALQRHGFLTESGRRVLPIEQQHDPAFDAGRLENLNRPEDLAFVIYTSGSTGRPKGVECTHGGMLSRFHWMWRDYPFQEDEICCAKTSLNFVDSVWEMLGGLLRGVPTVVADETTARDPGALLDLIRRFRVTRLIVVPALATAMLAEARRSGSGMESLRFLTFSGEPLASELVRSALESNPETTVLNLYGASETAADATCFEVQEEDLGGARVPIGRPIGVMRAHVLDDSLAPVAPGSPGELFLSGPGLARGYRNLPALTAEKFLDNPFVDPATPDAELHRRLFRTGDMVCQRSDGSLDFVGRKDFQIKIRGMRIEPGEIEAVLVEHPAVRACAVGEVETPAGRQLAAFHLPEGAEAASARELRGFLAATLADYMVPSIFVRVERLPLLPNGKLDRRALALPADFRPEGEHVAPADETERRLAAIWQEVLGLSLVGTADDFFEIGGDSISAFRVAALAKEAGLAVAPADLTDAPTIALLAKRAGAPSAILVDREPATGEMPLSPMQRYYFTWAKPNPHRFNVGFIARLAEPAVVPQLKAALGHVVRHHDALRLRFHRDAEGEWHQRFTDDPAVYDVPIHEIALPEGDTASRLEAIKAGIDRLHDTLDIGRGPVLAVGLFRGRAPDEEHFFFVMHELVTDAMSLQIVLDDLRRAYGQLGRGEAVALPAKTTSYRQWIGKVMDYARVGPARAQWPYWLAAAEAEPFPEDDPRPGALQRDIELFDFEVLDAATLTAARRRLQGGFQGRLLDSVFASLTLTAHALSGQTSLVFHKVAHGREAAIRDADVSRTVGWFITHTPITFRLPGIPAGEAPDEAALARVLAAVSEQHRAIPDNGLGHSALRHFADDPRVATLADQDEVKTLFQYIGDIWEQNYDGVLFRRPAPELTDVPDAAAAENLADYHLHVYAYVMDEAFRIKFFYTRPNYGEATIRRMAAVFSDRMLRLMALP